MARLPVPGAELTPEPDRSRIDLAAAVPASVLELLSTLWSAGFAAYVVGGSLRDVLLGRPATDWDLATSARPERTQALFGDRARYENQFGTVAVAVGDPAIDPVEITTFRTDHDYADFRRPHRVEFGDSIELDLARRDFTINAMAWGAEPGGPPAASAPSLLDPFGGRRDLAGPTIRAVGDPGGRFDEDALRMIRAIRSPERCRT